MRSRSPHAAMATAVVCAPGNAGIARDVEVAAVAIDDHDGLVGLGRDRATSTSSSSAPRRRSSPGSPTSCATPGLRVFGPSRAAAQLEGSKAFAKEIMAAGGSPDRGLRNGDRRRDRGWRWSRDSDCPSRSRPTGSPPARAWSSPARPTRPVRRWSPASTTRAFGDAGRQRRRRGGHDGPRGLAARDQRRQPDRPPAARTRLQADRRGEHRAQHRRDGFDLAAGRRLRRARRRDPRDGPPPGHRRRWRAAGRRSPACSTPG